MDETIPKFRSIANEVIRYINGQLQRERERRRIYPHNELTLRFFVGLTYKSDGHIEFTGLHCEAAGRSLESFDSIFT